jgi:hypothetical protein
LISVTMGVCIRVTFLSWPRLPRAGKEPARAPVNADRNDVQRAPRVAHRAVRAIGAAARDPFMEGHEGGRTLFNLLGIAILGVVVFTVRNTPGLTWVAILLGAPATALLHLQTSRTSPRRRRRR